MRKVQAGGVIRTSLDNTWQTPERVLDCVRAYFGGAIPFDAATAADNPTKATRFCAGPPGTLFVGDGLETKNGLEVAWDWPTWVNPPYGTEIRAWIYKMEVEAGRGTEIVALLPASRWESEYLPRALALGCAICFHRGRIAFVSSIDGAEVPGNPSANMFVAWNVNHVRFLEAFKPLGRCFSLAELVAIAAAGLGREPYPQGQKGCAQGAPFSKPRGEA